MGREKRVSAVRRKHASACCRSPAWAGRRQIANCAWLSILHGCLDCTFLISEAFAGPELSIALCLCELLEFAVVFLPTLFPPAATHLRQAQEVALLVARTIPPRHCSGLGGCHHSTLQQSSMSCIRAAVGLTGANVAPRRGCACPATLPLPPPCGCRLPRRQAVHREHGGCSRAASRLGEWHWTALSAKPRQMTASDAPSASRSGGHARLVQTAASPRGDGSFAVGVGARGGSREGGWGC